MGRPKLAPEDRLVTVSATLDRRSIDFAKRLGRDKLSVGLRKAIRIAEGISSTNPILFDLFKNSPDDELGKLAEGEMK